MTEPEKPCPQSTKDAVAYFTLWIKKLEETVDFRFDAVEQARRIAAEVTDVRLKNTNEWRESVQNREVSFFTKTEHEAYEKAVEVELRVFRELKTIVDTKANQRSLTVAYIMSGISLLIGVGGFTLAILSVVLRILGY